MSKGTSKFLKHHTQKVQVIMKKHRKFLVTDKPESTLQTQYFLQPVHQSDPPSPSLLSSSSAPVPKIIEMYNVLQGYMEKHFITSTRTASKQQTKLLISIEAKGTKTDKM